MSFTAFGLKGCQSTCESGPPPPYSGPKAPRTTKREWTATSTEQPG